MFAAFKQITKISFGIVTLVLASSSAHAQFEDPPVKWKKLDCATVDGSFNKMVIKADQKEDVAIKVEIDSVQRGSASLAKDVFDAMQASGQFHVEMDLENGVEGKLAPVEIALYYGSAGIFYGVLRNPVDVNTSNRVACNQPESLIQ